MKEEKRYLVREISIPGLSRFEVTLHPDQLVRLRNIAACYPKLTIAELLEKMLDDAVGMATDVLRMTQPEAMKLMENYGEQAFERVIEGLEPELKALIREKAEEYRKKRGG